MIFVILFFFFYWGLESIGYNSFIDEILNITDNPEWKEFMSFEKYKQYYELIKSYIFIKLLIASFLFNLLYLLYLIIITLL